MQKQHRLNFLFEIQPMPLFFNPVPDLIRYFFAVIVVAPVVAFTGGFCV